MLQNKTVSQQKNINPAYWVPTAYFAMGLPFIAVNLVSFNMIGFYPDCLGLPED